MSIELTESFKNMLVETALKLKGAFKRRFQAQTVLELGHGGSLLTQKELGWDRDTIRKGLKELKSGITCIDNYSARGRKRVEKKLPSLLSDSICVTALKSVFCSDATREPSLTEQYWIVTPSRPQAI